MFFTKQDIHFIWWSLTHWKVNGYILHKDVIRTIFRMILQSNTMNESVKANFTKAMSDVISIKFMKGIDYRDCHYHSTEYSTLDIHDGEPLKNNITFEWSVHPLNGTREVGTNLRKIMKHYINQHNQDEKNKHVDLTIINNEDIRYIYDVRPIYKTVNGRRYYTLTYLTDGYDLSDNDD